MAASDCPQGYQCEFIDSVPEDFYCKKCALVARRLIFTSCCEETYCHACTADIQKQGKPCPACEKEAFTTVELMKYQKKVNQLQVYCSMKERGCDWSGTLEQLDTHLDPDQDNCQYVDTKCPLNCHMTIPKNKVEQHVAQHCAKRPYVCQYCSFKATYEEVVDAHLLECKYVPLQCPNLCGVTFERDFMEDHMKMCRLEEVGCEFSGVGCDGRFIREDQEEHTRQNSHNHLTLTASLAVETKEQLQQKLLEQDKKHKEEEKKLRQKIEEQEKKIEKQEKKIEKQERKMEEQEKKIEKEEKKMEEQKNKIEEQEKKKEKQEKKMEEQEKKMEEHQKKLNEVKKRFQDQDRDHKEENKMLKQILEEQGERQKELEENFLKLSRAFSFNGRFKMESFSKEKAKQVVCTWKSPAMYTHVSGYQFCIGVDANGRGLGHGKSIYVAVWGMPGEFDDQLKWPAKAKFAIELINQQGGENATSTTLVDIERSTTPYKFLASFQRITIGGYHAFLEHSLLHKFLINDTLHVRVSEIHLL